MLNCSWPVLGNEEDECPTIEAHYALLRVELGGGKIVYVLVSMVKELQRIYCQCLRDYVMNSTEKAWLTAFVRV